jgi:hypothetical protein
MTHDERRLVRHLATAVVVKLIVLTALWWLFFHDARVAVDAERTAAQLGTPMSPPGGTR